MPAVKAALHRGELRAAAPVPSADPPRAVSPALRATRASFNAHDWDGVRALLADDVKLDRRRLRKLGGREVGSYFTNYEGARDWHLTPAWLDGREVLGVRRDPSAARPGYVIVLTWRDGRVQTIRDYRYVPYIAQEGVFEFAG